MPKYSKEQIKEIIEKVDYISSINNRSIPIKNIEDSANLAAYFAGFSSWKEYIKSVKKKYKINYEFSDIKQESKKEIKLSLKNSIDYKIKTINKNINKNIVNENNFLLHKIIFGYSLDLITKSKTPNAINAENTIIVGNNDSFFNSFYEYLSDNKQTILSFGNDTTCFYLDPIFEILENNQIDLFFYSKNSSEFITVWDLILKYLYKEYDLNFDTYFLKKSISLEFIVDMYFSLKIKNHFLSGIILNYLNKNIGLNIVDEQVTVKNENFDAHFNFSKDILDKINTLEFGYVNNFFQYTNKSILTSLYSKESLKIFIPYKIEKNFIFVLNTVLNIVFDEYSRNISGISKKYHNVFLINNNEKLSEIFITSDYCVYFCFVYPNNNYKIQNYEQVIFLKHDSYIEPNIEFIKKFYLETKELQFNIFYSSGLLLNKLERNSFYLWNENEFSYKLSKVFFDIH